MKNPTILIVDDEKLIRSYLRNLLALAGHQVIEAADGMEAREKVKQNEGSIALLITDIRMPHMDGATLGRLIADGYPDIPVLYISGYAFDIEAQRAHHLRNTCGFLAKPFTREALLEAVHGCLAPFKSEPIPV